jgi:glutamate racemase
VKIGVFDSGVGGLSVVNAINKAIPDMEVIYKEDKEHVPYGTKPVEQVHGFVRPIFQGLIDEGCQVIVVACNTVTTNLISQLREEFPVPMVGMEPMVKPAAAASKTGVIWLCATPRKLSSKRYGWLKAQYAPSTTVLEPDCRDWAEMIEANRVNREKVAKTINDSIAKGADQIVLGCTHYHWIEELIKDSAAGRAEVLQPEVPVVKQLKLVLERLA